MGGHGTRRVNASQRVLVLEVDQGGFSRRRSRQEDFLTGQNSWGRHDFTVSQVLRRSQEVPTITGGSVASQHHRCSSLQAADECSPRCYGGTAATDVSYDMPCVVPRISRSWIFSVCKRVTRSTATTTTGSLHVAPVPRSIAHLRHCLYSAFCRCAKRQPRQRLFVGWRFASSPCTVICAAR